MLWWLLVVALVLLPAAGAGAWSYRQPPTYAAEVDMLQQPTTTTTTTDIIDRQLATHQVLMMREALVHDVARSVGRDPDELTQNTSVAVVGDSAVIRLRVEDQDPDRAVQSAGSLADRYARISAGLVGSSDIGPIEIVSQSRVLADPVGPQPVRAVAAGLVVGAVLAVSAVALLGLRRKRTGASAT